MQAYASAPYNQPASVISTLASGNWCNPPGSGLGLRPTANTGVPLLDAYLWVKTPGQSDGQCDAAGGVRAWDYTAYTQPGWPTTAAQQALFDPLWGIVDPAAGAWFPPAGAPARAGRQPPVAPAPAGPGAAGSGTPRWTGDPGFSGAARQWSVHRTMLEETSRKPVSLLYPRRPGGAPGTAKVGALC